MPATQLDIGRLYEAEQNKLLAIVRRIVGSTSTAEDIVHQTFAAILGKPDRESLTAAYIVQAARNRALNHRRDTSRRAEIEVVDFDASSIPDERPSAETVVLFRDELRRLLEALAGLSSRRREAFVLNKIEGLNYDEVGARMGISRNTVITLVVTAMAQLDQQL